MNGNDDRFYGDDLTRVSLSDWSSPLYSDNFWGPERNSQNHGFHEETKAGSANPWLFLTLSMVFVVVSICFW